LFTPAVTKDSKCSSEIWLVIGSTTATTLAPCER
jgi:hypothetical protein